MGQTFPIYFIPIVPNSINQNASWGQHSGHSSKVSCVLFMHFLITLVGRIGVNVWMDW